MEHLLKAKLTILKKIRIDEQEKIKKEIFDGIKENSRNKIKEIDHCMNMIKNKLEKEYNIFIR